MEPGGQAATQAGLVWTCNFLGIRSPDGVLPRPSGRNAPGLESGYLIAMIGLY